MPKAVELAFAVCRASWKARSGLDITSSPAKMQFYREIAGHFAGCGQTRIWVATLDEQPVALEYHVTDGRKLYFLDSDFDQDHEKLSPGTVLLYRVIEQLHGEPIDEFDFGGDAFGYKLKWATGVRKHFSIEIFNRRLYSRFLYQAKNRLMPALRRIFGPKMPVAETEAREAEDN